MIKKNNTLKLSCENKDGRLNYYLFKIDMGCHSPRVVLAGINLSVQLEDSEPYAGNCLLVKMDGKTEFAPAVIDQSSGDYQKVEKHLADNQLAKASEFFKLI